MLDQSISPETGDFYFGTFEEYLPGTDRLALLPGSAHLARGPRFWRCDQVGVEPQPADEAGAPANGVCQFVGSETAVTDEDDRSFREPAQDHQQASASPVGERFVAPSHPFGPSLRGASRVRTGTLMPGSQGSGDSSMTLSQRMPLV